MKGPTFFGDTIKKSPAKHSKEESGFEHPHPHTKGEEQVAEGVKRSQKRLIKSGRYSPVVPSEMKEMQETGSEVEQDLRETPEIKKTVS